MAYTIIHESKKSKKLKSLAQNTGTVYTLGRLWHKQNLDSLPFEHQLPDQGAPAASSTP